MDNIKPPRYKAGSKFFDQDLKDFYHQINYPAEWLDEGQKYAPEDAYVISHPSWFFEPMPPVPVTSIYELFLDTVLKYPDETAVIFLDKGITYRQLDELVCKYAALLKDIGIQKGDVVATMLPNSLQHIVAFYAVTMIGAVHAPINVMYQTDEIAYQIKDSGAKTILILDLLFEKVSELKNDGLIENVIVTNFKDWAAPDAVIPSAMKLLWDIPKQAIEGTIDFFESLEKCEPLPESLPIDPENDTALLLYTTGTTGRTIGVIETHFNLVFNSLTHTHAFRPIEKKEINFSIMPMFHTTGYLLHQLPAFYQGGTVIPIPKFDMEDTFRVIETYGVNVIFAPPTFYTALLSRAELFERYNLSSIKMTIGCGAPVPQKLQDEWLQKTGARLINGWGMTETNSGGIISIPGIKEKYDSLGIPVYPEVKITDSQGNIVSRNTEGEICYRGLQVASGYLNNPGQTQETFLPDGWLRTGDSGFIDEEDFVHFVDRIKDVIVTSGYKTSPLEVESVLYLHPAIEDAVVVGQSDPKLGEAVKAVISLKIEHIGRVSEADIIEFCKEQLAAYKVPSIVEIRDILPKSPVGKIMKKDFKDLE